MPENTYTIKVETTTAETNVQNLLNKVTALVNALKNLSEATKDGILSNPEALGNLQALSQAQAGGGGAGGGNPVTASVNAARAQTGAGTAPSVSSTGTPAGTTNPTAAVGNVQAPAAAAGGAPAGVAVAAGPQTGNPKGTKSTTTYSQMEAAVVAAEAAHAANPTPDTAYALAQAQNRLLQANKIISPPAGGGPFDWSSSQFARTGTGFIAGQALVTTANTWMDIESQRIIHGGANVMGRGQATGAAIGAVVGGGIGLAVGGIPGMLIGGALVSQLGSSAGGLFAAPQQSAIDVATASRISGAFTGGASYEMFPKMSAAIRDFGNGESQPSAATLAQAWSSIAGGMFAGGIRPEAIQYLRSPGQQPSASNPAIGGFYQSNGGNNLWKNQYRGGLPIQGSSMNRGYSTSAGYTMALGALFGDETVPQMAAEQGRIFSGYAGAGANVADLTKQFGAEAMGRHYAMRYIAGDYSMRDLRRGRPYPYTLGEAGIDFPDPEALSRFAGESAAADREARLGSYRARGSGAAVYGALQHSKDAAASLPGGIDSEVYASAAAKQREAQMAMYGQQDIEAYGIPQTRLSAQRGVLNALPYAPGYRFGVELQSIALNRRQMGVVQQRLAKGNLTEEQQLKLEEQLANLQVSTATSISSLTEGLENRLPALAAGRPSRFSRMDSMQLAALNIGRMGHPSRSFGAVNGRQLGEQNAFVNDLLGPGGSDMIAPMSRDMPVGSGRIEALLERIAQILQQNGSAGQGPRTRVGEAVNKGQAVATGNPAPNYGGGNYN